MPLVVQRNEARIFSFTDSQQFSSHLLKRFSINELNQAGINVKAVPSTIVLEAENQLLARIPKKFGEQFLEERRRSGCNFITQLPFSTIKEDVGMVGLLGNEDKRGIRVNFAW